MFALDTQFPNADTSMSIAMSLLGEVYIYWFEYNAKLLNASFSS